MQDQARMAALESTSIDLIQASLTPSTVKCYNTTLVQFQTFLSTLNCQSAGLPANPGHVVLFIAELFKSGLSASTIVSKMSAITYFHKINSFPDPMSHFIVQKALSGAKKLASTTDVRLPITLPMLKNMLDNAHKVVKSEYFAKMFKAMMSLSFFALLRPGEVTASPHNLLFENVHVTQQQVTITFMSFKHHKGQPVSLLIPSQQQDPCPVKLLLEYLSVRGNTCGPLFCQHKQRPVSYAQFHDWFHDLLKYLSITQVYGLHSFRIGSATLLATKNTSSVLIQQMGRWHSNAYTRYIRIPVIKM